MLFSSLVLAAPLPTTNTNGVIKWAVKSDAPQTLFIDFYVDGQQIVRSYNQSASSINLDTRRLQNGGHELLSVAYGPGEARVGQQLNTINTQNGHAVSGIGPIYKTIYLKPGATTSLAIQTSFSDGKFDSYGGSATFVSNNPNVVTVDSTGKLTAKTSGVVTVSVVAGGYQSSARIISDTFTGFAHFSRGGKELTQYTAGQSTLARSMFYLGPAELDRTPGLAAQVKSAGINTLTTSFYQNPADVPRSGLAEWKASFDSQWSKNMATARQYDMNLMLIGDDVARTNSELQNSIHNAWSADAIRYALQTVAGSGRVISIEMVDEVNQLWGNAPDANFAALMSIIHGALARPSITWPTVANASNDAVSKWMGDVNYSDYTSLYWDVNELAAYATGPSTAQYGNGQRHGSIDRAAVIQRDAPVTILTGAAGEYYQNVGAGSAVYQAGEDILHVGVTPPATVAMEIMNAVALGASGIRTYGYDGHWANERLTADDGQNCQTGASPTGAGQDRWRAMSAAFNTVAQIEPYLLNQQINARDLGDSFITSARQAKNGRLFMAVNNSSRPVTIDVNLGAYLYAGGMVSRYRVVGEAKSKSTGPAAATDSVRFAPGEAIVWIETPVGAPSAVSPSTLATLFPDSQDVGDARHLLSDFGPGNKMTAP